MSSPDTNERPKRPMPAKLILNRKPFRPGHPGLKRCTSITKAGKPCGHLAAHGQETCYIHHRQIRARLHTLRRERCPVLRIKRPQCQCTRPVARGSTSGVCTWHATLAARGVPLVLVPAGQRVARMPPRERKPKRASPMLAHAAPRELRALPVWRACAGQRERAALVSAYLQRDVHPDTWRAAVRDVLARAQERDT